MDSEGEKVPDLLAPWGWSHWRVLGPGGVCLACAWEEAVLLCEKWGLEGRVGEGHRVKRSHAFGLSTWGDVCLLPSRANRRASRSGMMRSWVCAVLRRPPGELRWAVCVRGVSGRGLGGAVPSCRWQESLAVGRGRRRVGPESRGGAGPVQGP